MTIGFGTSQHFTARRKYSAALHLGDVEALDVSDGVKSEVPRERHGQVVPQGQQLPALISQIVDELRVLPVLSR